MKLHLLLLLPALSASFYPENVAFLSSINSPQATTDYNQIVTNQQLTRTQMEQQLGQWATKYGATVRFFPDYLALSHKMFPPWHFFDFWPTFLQSIPSLPLSFPNPPHSELPVPQIEEVPSHSPYHCLHNRLRVTVDRVKIALNSSINPTIPVSHKSNT